MDLKQIERCLKYFLLVKATIDSLLPDEMDVMFHGLVESYTTMKVIDVPEPAAINRAPVALTFNDVDEDTCYSRYRFLKPDLWRLHKALKLDEFEDGYIRAGSLANPSKYNKYGTEEALLILLHRLAFPTRFVDMVSIYHRDITALSRIFSWMNNYVRTRFGYLLTNNWDFWKDNFEEYAECIRKKVVEKSEGAINYPPGSYLVFGFIDDTSIRTCRPGGGPAAEGENAERNSMLLQESFYFGYKKHHGIKFQTIELPDGMCAHLFGPKSYRESDVDLLTASGIVPALFEITRGGKQFAIYCDGVFPTVGNLISKHVGNTDRADR
jgi:hypothetical protein